MDLIKEVINNKEFILLSLSIVSLLIPIIQLILKKNYEQKLTNYNIFHELVNKLNNVDGTVGLSQQMAIIYELKNFPQYFPIIKRILKQNISHWELKKESDKGNLEKYKILINEATITLDFIEKVKDEEYLLITLSIE